MRRIAIAIDIQWPYRHHQDAIHGILKFGRERTWACEMNLFAEAAGRPYDGVIGRVSTELAAWSRRTRTPTVNLWINSPDRTLPRVVADLAAGGRLAAGHLIGRGYRRFGFLGRVDDASWRMEFEGFRDVVRRHGFPCAKQLVSEDVSRASDWQALQRSLGAWVSSWVPPLGILCSTDVLARYLSDLCLGRGIRIPEDVAIVGSGNTALLCDHLEPGLTSLDFGYERVGRTSAELLESLMDGRRPPARPILVPPSGLQARRSTDAFSVEEPTVAAAMRLIWERSERPLKVPSLLKEIPASRRTLERRFRETLGRTIRQEIERSRVERAKALLVETRKPLKVIASASGFADPQQFSRVFRKSEGRTPLQYRRRHRRN